MKTALYNSYGSTEVIEIKDVPIPTLKQSELLIKVEAAGLNPKDILLRKGKFQGLSGKKFPKQIGFDFAGIIEDSHHSTIFKKGDAVFGMVNGWNGRCCSEYVNVAENELYHLPTNISFEETAGIPLAGQTALQAIRDEADLRTGQSICINGASGGVGTLAIQIAKELGGIVTTISSQKNIALCQSLGADHAIDYNQTDINRSHQKFDVFFDVFGNYSFKLISQNLTKRGVYVTTVPSLSIIRDKAANLFRRKKARLVVVRSKSSDLQWLSNKIVSQKIVPVIDKIFPLDDMKAAQKQIETKRAKGKVIIKL
ncbi:MAG: NAD(P)-dependent alcohol dehydrogenase [Chitinophagales bacterium]